MRFNLSNWLWKMSYDRMKTGLVANGYFVEKENPLPTPLQLSGEEDPMLLPVRWKSIPQVRGVYGYGMSDNPFAEGDYEPLESERGIRKLALRDVLNDKPPGLFIADVRNRVYASLIKNP